MVDPRNCVRFQGGGGAQTPRPTDPGVAWRPGFWKGFLRNRAFRLGFGYFRALYENHAPLQVYDLREERLEARLTGSSTPWGRRPGEFLTLRASRRPVLLITARCLLPDIRYDEGVVEN